MDLNKMYDTRKGQKDINTNNFYPQKQEKGRHTQEVDVKFNIFSVIGLVVNTRAFIITI